MVETINEHAKDVLFRKPRSHNKWQDIPVSVAQLHELYELMKWGPTCANCFPTRIVFVCSDKERKKLAKLTYGTNQGKVLNAPVTAILAYDLDFYEWLTWLIPPKPEYRNLYADNQKLAVDTAFRNSSLQGAYFMFAARSIGLDCGPMSGFNNAAVDKLYFPDGRKQSNFLCGIGYGDLTGVWPRLPRPQFAQICSVV